MVRWYRVRHFWPHVEGRTSRRAGTLAAGVGVMLLVPTLAGASGPAGPATGGASGAAGPGATSLGAAAGCTAGTPNDFNGDGTTDVAIADPDATVGGVAGAGRVHVVFGGGAGSQTVSQADAFVAGDPEPGDGFGYGLAAYDANGDGCADLAVSTPFESIGTIPEAGSAQVLYGSPTGFGVVGGTNYNQSQADMPGGAEAGDRFGYSLAAGKTAAGAAFLVVGVPGEDLTDSGGTARTDAGAFMYLRGSTKLMVDQDDSGVPGVVEDDDRYGYAVVATGDHVAVSCPGEAIGEEAFAGGLAVFTHTVSSGALDAVAAVDEGQSGISGAPQANDWFGRSLSMVSYVPPAGGSPRSLLAIGAPGEALNSDTEPSAGRLVTVEATGQVTEHEPIHQGATGVDGATEPGDYFGWSLRLVNRTPGQAATWQNLLLAVGVPGEEGTGPLNEGAVQVFSMVGAPGDHDMWAQDELTTIDWSREDGLLGRAIGASRTHLYLADPYAATPSVYAVPWANLTDGATDPVITYQPGKDGLPATGAGTFGAAIA